MKTSLFIFTTITMLPWFLNTLRCKPCQKKGCIDAIILTYNEDPCLVQSLDNLLHNPYFCWVICVNDGLTDNTEAVTTEIRCKWGDRFIAVMQKNTGKGSVLMHGLKCTTCDQIFLSDADTFVPPGSDGMGYMLAEIEHGADAVGGISSTALRGAGLLPHIRTTAELPMIVTKRTLQQFLGGAPSTISGTCRMSRTDVLRKFSFSDRAGIEDLDLTWMLVIDGCCIRQANRYIVYPQECNSSRRKQRRWRHWIVGCVVYMRLHRRLLFSRFGILSILPMLLVVLHGVGIYLTTWSNEFITTGPHGVVLIMFPLTQVGVVRVISAFNVWFHRCQLLVPLTLLSVVHVLLVYAIWVIYGLIAFLTGRGPQHDKSTHYSALVEAPTAYSQPSVTGTEEPSEV